MDGLLGIYAAQPFWLWLAIGVVLLAIEAALSTEWLLWPTVSAGVVAVIVALGLDVGFLGEAGLFAALTVASTALSRRLIQKVNPEAAPDINDRDDRLIGQRARVVETFIDGRGRVFISGAEWAAELVDGASGPVIGDSVLVESTAGPALRVRPAA